MFRVAQLYVALAIFIRGAVECIQNAFDHRSGYDHLKCGESVTLQIYNMIVSDDVRRVAGSYEGLVRMPLYTMFNRLRDMLIEAAPSSEERANEGVIVEITKMFIFMVSESTLERRYEVYERHCSRIRLSGKDPLYLRRFGSLERIIDMLTFSAADRLFEPNTRLVSEIDGVMRVVRGEISRDKENRVGMARILEEVDRRRRALLVAEIAELRHIRHDDEEARKEIQARYTAERQAINADTDVKRYQLARMSSQDEIPKTPRETPGSRSNRHVTFDTNL